MSQSQCDWSSSQTSYRSLPNAGGENLYRCASPPPLRNLSVTSPIVDGAVDAQCSSSAARLRLSQLKVFVTSFSVVLALCASLLFFCLCADVRRCVDCVGGGRVRYEQVSLSCDDAHCDPIEDEIEVTDLRPLNSRKSNHRRD